jgi:uncharacterized protein YegL
MTDFMQNDPFLGNDPFKDQQVVTPGLGSIKTTGTNKLLNVLFIVDCSRSMDGERIMAVNAALTEVKSILQDIKNNNGLDLKIAIMSFTSSAKWELQLTDIDEVSLENLRTRAGLTEYGNAFHELNKVLRKDQFMKHTGKIAPPAIMFLTDGGPTDDYEADLKELLKNGWFANASRSAVLLGDAIHDDRARDAVKKFVEDPDNDIVDAENSTVIIQKIKIATMHTVAGDPMDKGNADEDVDTPVVKNDPLPTDPDPVDPTDADIPDFPDFPDIPDYPDFPTDGDIPDFPDSPIDLGTTDAQDPNKAKKNPFDNNGPFGDNGPFGTSANADDPFGGSANTDDPFGGCANTDDPFGTNAGTDDPFGTSGDFDPF